jgi:hypothetical protein
MFTIETSGKKLAKRIESTLKLYATVKDRLHADAISAIWHAAKHGDPVYLNRLNEGLGSNDQSALKLFIRRAQAIIGFNGANPDGKASDEVIAAVEAGTVLTFKEGQYLIAVKGGHNSDQAQALLFLCEERFINPNPEKGDAKVFDRNNFSEQKLLGSQEVLKALIKLNKEVQAGTNDKRKVNVDPKVAALLAEVAGKAETTLNQLSLAKAA